VTVGTGRAALLEPAMALPAFELHDALSSSGWAQINATKILVPEHLLGDSIVDREFIFEHVNDGACDGIWHLE